MKISAGRMFVVLISAALAACVVLPLSEGPSPDTRQNITDEVPAFIVTGVTTRADVLLRLGEPDGATEHDLQFTYTKGVRTGGVGYLLCGNTGCIAGNSSKMAYDRLVIQFDDKNVVSSSWHERNLCRESEFGNNSSRPCVNVTGQDLLLKQVSVTDGVVFPRTTWCQNFRVKWSNVAFPKACPRGNLVISNSAILLYPDNADSKSAPTLAVPYTTIASVEIVKDNFLFIGTNILGIAIKRADGTYDSIGIGVNWQGTIGLSDQEPNKRAGELILSRWQALTAK